VVAVVAVVAVRTLGVMLRVMTTLLAVVVAVAQVLSLDQAHQVVLQQGRKTTTTVIRAAAVH
jgi:hypothetical protein